MRARTAVAIVSLLLPAALSAQRIPVVIDMGRPRPQPIPPQPAPIANDIAYQRLRVSVESYPMVSYFAAPAYSTNGRTSSWASLGLGTRLDYRLTNVVSATLDLTSSLLGGPQAVYTAELGTRIHPEPKAGSRFAPFIDTRIGYVAAFTKGLDGLGTVFTDPYSQYYGAASYAHGFAVLGGGGFAYSLGMRWSLLTSAMVAASRMTAEDFRDPVQRGYTLGAVRYTLGLRYNPVRVIRRGDTR